VATVIQLDLFRATSKAFAIPAEVRALIDAGALFAVNHSGGKDSQAMLAILRKHVPAAQLIIVHAHLEGEEWEGVTDHIRRTCEGLDVIVAEPVKTFAQMVERRGMFPSPQQRQCTSDLKRGPIDREIRRYLAAHPEFQGRVVNCMGMRAQESAQRAKAATFKRSERNSVAGREWFDWLPIHDMTAAEVFDTIRAAGEKPHWAYAAGMSRLSCMFCVMASAHDLRTAARLNPEAYAERVALERRIGHTISMDGRSLEDVTGIRAMAAIAA
jgi:DNA sulfur modification protein DndC